VALGGTARKGAQGAGGLREQLQAPSEAKPQEPHEPTPPEEGPTLEEAASRWRQERAGYEGVDQLKSMREAYDANMAEYALQAQIRQVEAQIEREKNAAYLQEIHKIQNDKFVSLRVRQLEAEAKRVELELEAQKRELLVMDQQQIAPRAQSPRAERWNPLLKLQRDLLGNRMISTEEEARVAAKAAGLGEGEDEDEDAVKAKEEAMDAEKAAEIAAERAEKAKLDATKAREHALKTEREANLLKEKAVEAAKAKVRADAEAKARTEIIEKQKAEAAVKAKAEEDARAVLETEMNETKRADEEAMAKAKSEEEAIIVEEAKKKAKAKAEAADEAARIQAEAQAKSSDEDVVAEEMAARVAEEEAKMKAKVTAAEEEAKAKVNALKSNFDPDHFVFITPEEAMDRMAEEEAEEDMGVIAAQKETGNRMRFKVQLQGEMADEAEGGARALSELKALSETFNDLALIEVKASSLNSALFWVIVEMECVDIRQEVHAEDMLNDKLDENIGTFCLLNVEVIYQ